VNSVLKNLLWIVGALLLAGIGSFGGCLVGGSIGHGMDASAGTIGKGLEGSANELTLAFVGFVGGAVAALVASLIAWAVLSPPKSVGKERAWKILDSLGILTFVGASTFGGFALPVWLGARLFSVPLSGAGAGQNIVSGVAVVGGIAGLVFSVALSWEWWKRRRAQNTLNP